MGSEKRTKSLKRVQASRVSAKKMVAKRSAAKGGKIKKNRSAKGKTENKRKPERPSRAKKVGGAKKTEIVSSAANLENALTKLINDQLVCRDLLELDQFDKAEVLIKRLRQRLAAETRGDSAAQLLIRQSALEALLAEYGGVPNDVGFQLSPTDIKQELWSDLTKAIFFECSARIKLRRVLFLGLQAKEREEVRVDSSRAIESYRRLKMFRHAGEVCQRVACYYLTKDNAEADVGLALLREVQRYAKLGNSQELYHEASLKILTHEGVVGGVATRELVSKFERFCSSHKLSDRYPRVFLSGLVALGFNLSASSPELVEGFYRRALISAKKVKDYGNIFQAAFYLGTLLTDRVRSTNTPKNEEGDSSAKAKLSTRSGKNEIKKAQGNGDVTKQAEQALQVALAAAKKIRYNLGEISVECNLMRFHLLSGQLSEVERIFDGLMERKLPAVLVGICGLQIASLMVAAGYHQKGLNYVNELAAEFNRLKLIAKEAEALFIAGNIESLQLNWKAAVKSWRRSIRLDKKIGVSDSLFDKYQGIAHALLVACGELAPGSLERNQLIQGASEALNRAVNICSQGSEGGDLLNLAKVLQTQAHAAVISNKPSEALRFLASARPILERLGQRMDLGVGDALSGLVLLELAKGGKVNLFNEALSAFQRAEGFISSAGGGAILWKVHLYSAWTYFFWGVASTDAAKRYQMWEMAEQALLKAEASKNNPSSFNWAGGDMTNALVLSLFQGDDEIIYDFGFRLNAEFIKDQRRAEEWRGRNPRLRPAEMMH